MCLHILCYVFIHWPSHLSYLNSKWIVSHGGKREDKVTTILRSTRQFNRNRNELRRMKIEESTERKRRFWYRSDLHKFQLWHFKITVHWDSTKIRWLKKKKTEKQYSHWLFKQQKQNQNRWKQRKEKVSIDCSVALVMFAINCYSIRPNVKCCSSRKKTSKWITVETEEK